MGNFLVLGLPRSRTAWLSNFLTYGDISCTHEGLDGCISLEQYKSQFSLNSGDSNTGLAMFDFESHFTDFKKIIIEGSIEPAVTFSKRYFKHDSTDVMLKVKKRLSLIDGLHVPFHEINSNLENIWNYVSSYQFNERRAQRLVTFDIQMRDIYSMDNSSMVQLINNTKNYF